MIKGLANILYPNGSAFKVSKKSNRDRLHDSIDFTLNDFFDLESTFLNGLYPDNNDITVEEVDFLSYIYGVNYPSGITFEQQKELLLNVMNRTYATKHKQSAIYIEKVLNDFGFDVMVTENVNWEIPNELKTVNQTQHSIDVQHGLGQQMGMKQLPFIANSPNPNEVFSYGSGNIWAIFFITGKDGLDELIPVSDSRMREFRELVLKLKPAHTIALLNVPNDNTLGADFNNDFNDDFLI